MTTPYAPPPEAAEVFGARLGLAERYVALLAEEGTTWGLLGPREGPRLWERHVLNSAALRALVPPDATCLDVGSGAGLPGLAVALARPDVAMTLVEPLQRRVDFLRLAVDTLGVGAQVEVVRARAEELHGRMTAARVLARALAPLDRLVPWTLPLAAPDGSVLALRGASARSEVAEAAAVLGRHRASADVVEVPAGGGATATVVHVRRRP